MDAYRWFSFKVWVPGEGEDDAAEGYEYLEEERGVTLEDAKETYRLKYPQVVVLAGSDEYNEAGADGEVELD